MKGKIFNIQRFSLFDGPGIRTVVFLKGCPLDCIWCHNPEGKTNKTGIMYDASKCIGCGECVEKCKYGLHSLTDGIHFYNRANCIGCGACAENCYSEALKIAGNTVTSEEVINDVMKDIRYYTESGGGLTLSGGEPLMQADFSAEILRFAKVNGINTCVETSGFGSEENLLKVAKYTDLFLFDCKQTDSTLHKKYCGVDNEIILKNLKILNENNNSVILSCPIVPGCNDTNEHIEGIAKLAARYHCIESIKLEPYHKLGVNKSVQYGFEKYFDTNVPNETLMENYRYKIEMLSGKPCIIS